MSENREAPGPSRRKSLRSSTRPSLFKIMDPSCISEHFGISLNSDSSSDDEEFIPTDAAAVSEVSDDGASESSDSEKSEEEEEGEEEEEEEEREEGPGERDTISPTTFESVDMAVTMTNDESTPICSVCLETAHDHDIVTCDACGLSVHEGCYGVPEDDGVDETQSNLSSFSTIPWFCDSCRAGVENPSCCLCPVEGGLFKQAINGEWVHIVCGLYCEGVEFINPLLLSGITLDQINPSKFGAKSCQLCDEDWLSQTGICIQCDAGLCKVYFHATCGLKNGLLCESDDSVRSSLSPNEGRPKKRRKEEITDPYFAHCLAHSDKKEVKRKKKRYYKMIESIKRFKKPENDTRLNKYLLEANESYSKMFKEMREWYQPDKIVKQGRRLLQSHPEAFKLLTRKAQLLGFGQDRTTLSSHSYRGNVPIGLTEEFVKFFNSRMLKINKLKTENDQLSGKRSQLKDKSLKIQEARKETDAELAAVKQNCHILSDRIKIICTLANEAAGKPILDSSKYLVDIHDDDDNPNCNNDHTSQMCCICKGCNDDHLMAQCDTCSLYYHINCLDPPLTRVPLKTSRQGWQCEDCGLNSEDELKPAIPHNSDPQSSFGRKINFSNNWQFIEFSPLRKVRRQGKKRGRKRI
ncbi:PREDICTED: PHD finger protein 14-like [Amphimedon queenslandica]|uniref:PHD finger protein 14 n=1 Tax=Amphimedon queenslandica TaxID=400682 RepID=A0A1X7VQ78_AMPQE|nr:PREDICTED: PHD finger protein 14-like [Amphimedon queenslandica]|eukprot:XP_019857796.1 PREDICTED: PHD finger protein 14-like [Amphimedon queenslandica]